MQAPEWFHWHGMHRYWEWFEDDHNVMLTCKLCQASIVYSITPQHPTPYEITVDCLAHIIYKHTKELHATGTTLDQH